MGQVLAMNVSELRSQNTGNLLLQRWEAETRLCRSSEKLAGQLAWYTQQ